MAHEKGRWRPPYDFAAARPTFVDAWPQAWHDLAPASVLVPLSRAESNALGAQIMGFQHWFTPASARPLLDVARRLDAVIARQGRSSVVRLTSRSPKDSLFAQRHGLRVRDGAQALALFMEGSERCAADLRMALDGGHDMALVVRAWVECPPWAEVRCFMVNHAWVGASQVQPLDGAAVPPPTPHLQAVLVALHRSMRSLVHAAPIAHAAFDLVLTACREQGPPSMSARLLDVNPLTEVTDLALFAPAADFDRTFRFRHPHGQAISKVPLPVRGPEADRFF